MTVAKVQGVTGNTASQTLNSVVAGNCLTYQDAYFRNATTGAAEAAPTDTNGTFTVGRSDAPQTIGADDQGAAGFFEKNCAAGTHTVTPEVNSGHNAALTEWSGVDTVSPLIAGNSGKSSGAGTSQATGASASANSGDLSLVQFGMAATTTGVADVGFTDPITNYTTLQKITNDAIDVATLHSYRVLSASGTENATVNWTNSEADQFWQASIFVLKAATGGIGPNLAIIIRGGRGVDLGPAGRRMMPQQFPVPNPPDTTASPAAPFMVSRGPAMGPPKRRRFPQRFSDTPAAAPSAITYPQLEHVNARGGFRGILLGER